MCLLGNVRKRMVENLEARGINIRAKARPGADTKTTHQVLGGGPNVEERSRSEFLHTLKAWCRDSRSRGCVSSAAELLAKSGH